MAFRERLAEVLPQDQPRPALHRRLVALGERDRLALVVGAVVPQLQVEAVRGEDRVVRGAGGEARGHLMADGVALKARERAGVVAVLVGADGERLRLGRGEPDGGGGATLDAPRGGAAELRL